MRMFLRGVGTLIVMAAAATSVVAQTQTEVSYSGNYGWTYDGYYVGPYRGTVSYLGSETLDIYCVDSAHWVTNSSWTADITSLTAGNLANTYLAGASDAMDRYWMAAYLSTRYWMSGIDSRVEMAAIHAAIWNLTTGHQPSGFDAPYSSTNQYANTNYWMDQARTNYAGFRAQSLPGEWLVLTDVEGSSQEFLVRNTNVVPEPETWLLLLTGLGGVLGVGVARGRPI